MTIRDLIEQLSKLNPDMKVACAENLYSRTDKNYYATPKLITRTAVSPWFFETTPEDYGDNKECFEPILIIS